MTDSPNKDFNPKHRVVGAVVLVAIAVIVLPMILDDGGDDRHAGDDQATPPVENQVFVADLTQSGSKAAFASPPASVATAPASAPVPATPAAKTGNAAPAPVSGKNAAPEPRNAHAAVPVDKGFYVQVGTFGNQANARQLADKLKQHGYSVHLERVRLASGSALRVRVGPYMQSDQAQAARAAIQRKLDVQGIVRAY